MSVPVHPVLATAAMLGEGPIWVERDAALWFVDIKGHRIHRLDPATRDTQSWDAPGQVGWIVPARSGLFVVGLQTGLHHFDPATGAFDLIHAPERHLPGNRLNDATVAADGGIWFGSMDDAEEDDSGRVYRFHAGTCTDAGLPPVCIVNGPALSPDGRLLYHVDTLGGTIWRSALDQDGRILETAAFVRIEEGAGFPDGPVVDAQGAVWIGLFGGWAVRRYGADGTLLATIPFPVANVTKIAFGGENLSTVYATTARKGVSEDELQAQPLTGHVFAFEAGVRGQKGHLAAIAP